MRDDMNTSGCEQIMRTTLPELGHGFDQVRTDKLRNPLRRLLTELGLKFDFQDTIGKELFVLGSKLFERMVDSNIRPPPVVSRSTTSIPVILADHRKFSVERDTDTSISWELEGGPVVEGAHH